MALDNSQFAEWIAKARQGDESARNRLFAGCRSFVAVVARVQLHRRLQSKIEPSDLVQQSLLEAHRGFEDFQGATPVEWLAWLKQIVKHNAMDADQHYRQAERRNLRKERSLEFTDSSGSQGELCLADPGPGPSQNISKLEQEMQLAAAIEALPDDYRQVVLLRNIERLPFDQVAERMNRTRGACQMLWMRAIEQLRSQLKDESTS
jgi:RNA polymerase sigma-70 factor (ECF subfamily)